MNAGPGDPETERAEDSATWLGLDERVKPLVQAGIVLGIGIGGFFDGIVLHQLLQTHHMLSARTDTTDLADIQLNVVVDGLFHVVTLAFTLVGIWLILRAWKRPEVPPSGRVLAGSALGGWGLFNLVEGVVNHYVLVLHRVWPDGPGGALVWDVAFLASGVVLLVVGYVLIRTAEPADPGTRDESRPTTDGDV